MQRTLELARIDYDAAVQAREAANTYYAELEKRSKKSRQEAEDAYAAAQFGYQHEYLSAAELRQAEIDYEMTLWQLEQDLLAAKLKAGDDAVRREKLSLTAAQEDLREVKDQIESLVVRAPFDGIITYYSDLFIGDTYRSDQVLFTIAEDSSFYITVDLDDTDVRMGHSLHTGIEVQLKARILVEGEWTDIEFEGQVISASPDLRSDASLSDDNTVVIDVPEWPSHIDIGTSGIIVSVPRDVRYNVVVIPINTVYMTGSSYRYVRVVENGISKERPVELGLMGLTEVEIISGLEPGEEIAVR
ncbi:MAG: HlyD family efflux transporter periplasmic adaptor subunit [Clostridiales bacterium]|nr:HlyD family efflux transporter periplasmic adaptor subunit [Clostridiales bacterium]